MPTTHPALSQHLAEPTKAQWTSGGGNTTTSDKVGISKSLSEDTDLLKLEDTGFNSNLVGLVFKSFSGSTAALRAKYTNPASTTATELQFYTNPAGGNNNLIQRMIIDGAGNVGIGTASPTQKLQVNGNFQADTVSVNPSYGVLTYAGGVPDTFNVLAHSGKALSFGSNDLYDRMILDTSGNVGIGTPTPQNKLHVAGSITVDGNINAKYQDVAEWVPSSEQLAAGTVVVLDSTKSNQVTSSSIGYDTRVAGVISAQPGIALGERGAGKVLVATTGRVRIKVDATKSPIRIGDLLVTSDIPGVAMKSEAVNLGGVQIHRPGTLIGKALEPLDKGTSEILVLLSLQ
jgi:hypothetical protein